MNKHAALVLVFITLTALSLVSVWQVKASPKTIIVPNDYPTIAAAVGKAADGDTIYVKSGTYVGTMVIDKALSLQGESKETTIINGNNAATVILIRHDNVNITGFTIIYDETPNTPKSLWMWSTRLAGIHIASAKNCNVYGNKVSDCGAGIWLYDAHQNNVSGNNFFNNDYGIRVEASTSNSLSTNTVTNNWGGIRLISSSNNKLRDNSMTNNAQNLGVSGDQLSTYINDVDASNTVDGKPLYYWVNASDEAVPTDAGCVVLVNCRGISVQGLSLTKNQDGILLASTQNSIVSNNNIAETDAGIRTYNSFNDSITGNNINSPVGINAGGNVTRIMGNTIKATGTGISMNGYYQTVSQNNVDAGTFGGGNDIINCKGSYNNISLNTLTGQTYVGIILEGSYNSFYDNTIARGEQMRVSGNWNIIAKNTLTDSGVSVSSGSNNIVCANRIANGLGLGIGGHSNIYYANQVENNYYVGADIIGTEAHSSNNTIYHNNFINNKQQVKNWGANPTNFWDNGSEGNYWSDYTGTDANGDGIGDAPYFVKSETFDENLGKVVEAVNGQDNYPLMAPFDTSSVTVQLPQWAYPTPSPSPLPTPSPSPTPTPTPTTTKTPSSSHSQSPSEVPTPSASPSQEPTPSPEPQSPPFPIELIYATAATGMIVGIALVTIALKKRQ